MHIVKATDPINIEHPVFLIFGPPGVCKSSLGFSAKDPLALDADEGAHRAANRKDTLLVPTWASIVELMAHPDALDPYATIVVDTVGRVLDKMAVAIMAEDPKNKTKGGAMSITGWGVMKTRFRQWITDLRAKGKDVILIAHESEEKVGDGYITRPDIQGGSYDEVMKVADFVGFVSVVNKQRVIDFNPTDEHPGKNPGRWESIVVPPIEKATDVLAKLMDAGRAALGHISEESAKVMQDVEGYRRQINAFETPEQFTELAAQVPGLQQSAPMVYAQVRKILVDRAKDAGYVYDLKSKRFKNPNAVKDQGMEEMASLRRSRAIAKVEGGK